MLQCHGRLRRETFTQSVDRRILIFENVHEVCHHVLDLVKIWLILIFCRNFISIFILGSFTPWFHALHAHGSFCDGSCLVQAEGIYSCQCFNTIQLLYQSFLVRQNECSERQCHTGKEDQSFRDHSQNTGHHAYDRILESISYYIVLFVE